MERVRERELDAVDLDGAAFVRAEDVLDALLAEPAASSTGATTVAAVLLRELDRVADVVAVAVRDRDHVDALGLCSASGHFGFPFRNGST